MGSILRLKIPLFIVIISSFLFSDILVGYSFAKPDFFRDRDQTQTISLEVLQSENPDEDYQSQIPALAYSLALIKSRYIEDVSLKELVRAAMRGLSAELDPYSEFLDETQYNRLLTETEGEYGGIGLVVGRREGNLYVIAPMKGTPADLAGIQPGDEILAIDGKDIHEFSMMDAIMALRGAEGKSVRLLLKRGQEDEPFEVEVKRKAIELRSVQDLIMLDSEIGYIRVIDFDTKVKKNLVKELKKFKKQKGKALILDLRNNPGGLLTRGAAVADLFLARGKLVVVTKGRDGREHFRLISKRKPYLKDLPLVVLINRGSASASEIVAGAIQDHQVGTVLGEKSFGKGSVQMVVPFGNGTAFRLTTDWYYTPSGRTIEGNGIIPDIEVERLPLSENELQQNPNSIESLLQDNQLKTAVQILKAEYGDTIHNS